MEDDTTVTEMIRLLVELRPDDDEEGQGLAEYALILGLIAVVAIVSLAFLGNTVNDMMSYIGATIEWARTQ